ncbi:MAG: hypothetical protein M3680_35400 [Myxococcota bacterium]|nr:hypothetical protein [Myxococcota bacterium]
MKNLLVVFALVIAACGGSKSTAQSPTGGPGDPAVDPTMPSWAPPSCSAYQKAVVQATACQAVEQTKRDEIQQAYDTASASWKAEQDATPERIEEVAAACASSAESVRAETVGNCGPTSEQ